MLRAPTFAFSNCRRLILRGTFSCANVSYSITSALPPAKCIADARRPSPRPAGERRPPLTVEHVAWEIPLGFDGTIKVFRRYPKDKVLDILGRVGVYGERDESPEVLFRRRGTLP